MCGFCRSMKVVKDFWGKLVDDFVVPVVIVVAASIYVIYLFGDRTTNDQNKRIRHTILQVDGIRRVLVVETPDGVGCCILPTTGEAP